ncbi:hypothetical protein TDB9533_04434 [Thalassocella blandensis]|nr:hypothetical protein TDB9533_04434 [Thalassocella blandensis]
MPTKKHLFIGFGDIARRCAEKLIDAGANVVGIARSNKSVPQGVEFWQGDITDTVTLHRLIKCEFDTVVITLTPDGRDEDAYRHAYWEPIQKLVQQWQQAPTQVKRIIFISSTRVYGQEQDEWVDEQSVCTPIDAQGRVLVQTEQCLLQSGLPACVLRFSGIYGPQRDFLLRQVMAGKPGDEHYTNRIHIDDCCAIIHFLIEHVPLASLPKILLASDNTPVKSSMIRAWLAQQLRQMPEVTQAESNDVSVGMKEHSAKRQTAPEKQQFTNNTGAHEKASQKSRTGSKRCNNAKLLQLGYQFKYPSFQDGYQAIIEEIFKGKSSAE